MEQLDPSIAQQIVIEYARVLERDISENRHPARVDSLPYPKPLIKSALCTSAQRLAATGQLTDELRAYLETAYTFLADYLDGELVELVDQYRRSADDLAASSPVVGDRTATAAWRTLIDSGSLAGELARTTTNEADALRTEFRKLLAGA
jgi:hypothetical protein